MKVITIKQPWATLIAEGLKEYEFRTWSTKYRGDILIHAGKSIDENAMERFKSYNLEYPIGCIIAKAKLIDSILVEKEFVNKVGPKNPLVYKNIIDNKDNSRKVYGFKLNEVQKIKPIYLNGKLGLWEYDYYDWRRK